MSELPIRGDVGLAECTRDPIFLLQSRRWQCSPDAIPTDVWFRDGSYRSLEVNDEGDFELISSVGASSGRTSITTARAAAMFSEHFWAEWRTERVFFTREEGEAYGEVRAYNYRDGWRVYCVCANGELAQILKAHSLAPTGTVKS